MRLSSLGTSRGSCGAISLTPALVTCISLLLFQYFGVLLLWRRPVYMHIYTHIYLMQLRERTLHPCHHSTEPAGSALLPEPPAAGRLPGSLGAKPWGISPFGDGQRGAQSCCSASDSPTNAPTPGHAAHGAERARERTRLPAPSRAAGHQILHRRGQQGTAARCLGLRGRFQQKHSPDTSLPQEVAAGKSPAGRAPHLLAHRAPS